MRCVVVKYTDALKDVRYLEMRALYWVECFNLMLQQ